MSARNLGLRPETPDALRRAVAASEPPNPASAMTGSPPQGAERLTARQMGIGPVEDRPRGIETTWKLDVPRRPCPCRRCTPPVPLEGWSER